MAIRTWLTTSKNSAQVVFGLNVQNFHWHVFPMPISVSDTQGPFTLRDTQEPIAPDTAITEREITLLYAFFWVVPRCRHQAVKIKII